MTTTRSVLLAALLILGALLVLPTAPAASAHPLPFVGGPAYESEASCYASSSASCTTSALSVSSGYGVILLQASSGNAVQTPVNSQSDTFVNETTCASAGASPTTIWADFSPTAASTTFGLPIGHSSFLMAVTVGASVLDALSSASCSTTNSNSPTLTLTSTQTNDLMLGVWMTQAARETASASTGTLIATSASDFSAHTGFGIYKSYASIGSTVVGGTLASGTTWWGSAIDLRSTLTATFTASPASPDVGKATTFTSSVSGGTGSGYTYAWVFGDSGGTSSSSAPSITFGTAGSFNAYLNVTDSGSNVFFVHNPFTVVLAPTASVTVAPPVLDAGAAGSFSANAAHGTTPYTYAWKFGDGGATSTSATPSQAYAGAGSWSAYVNVTDAQGIVAAAHITVTVHAALGLSFVVAPTDPIATSSASFTSTVTGGTSPFTYAWSFGGGGSHTSTSANPSYTYPSPGTVHCYLNVTDADSQTATVNHALTVVAGLSVSFTVSPPSPDVGQLTTFTSTVTGGAASYTYAWTLGAGATSTAASPTNTYASPGTYHIYVNATDSNSPASKAGTHHDVVVNADPTCSFTIAPTTPEVGVAASLTSTIVGGASPYTYSWTLGAGATSAVADPTNVYGSATTFSVYLNATDADSYVAECHTTVTVVAFVTVTFTASPMSPDVGEATTFTAVIVGGVTSFSYAWSLGGAVLSSASSPMHTYSTAATYHVYLNLTDGNGYVAEYDIDLTVNAVLAVSFTYSPLSPVVFEPVMFTSVVTGGLPGYTYAWVFGDGGATSASASPTYSFGNSGGWHVELNVTDANSVTAFYTLTVTVGSSGGSGPPILTGDDANRSAVILTWLLPPGSYVNLTIVWGLNLSALSHHISIGVPVLPVRGIGSLGSNTTYYFVLWTWTAPLTRGPDSNPVAVTTHVPASSGPPTPFPWGTLEQITTLSVAGGIAVSCAIAAYMDSKRIRPVRTLASAANARSTNRAPPRTPRTGEGRP